MPPKKSSLSTLKSTVVQFNNSVSKCNVVLNGKKYDKFAAVSNKLEECYDNLSTCWETYKEEFLASGKTEEDFNAKKEPPEDHLEAYVHNDAWKKDKENTFLDIFEKLTDDSPVEEEGKVDLDQVARCKVVCGEIQSQCDLIENAILSLESDVNRIIDGSAEESTVEGYRSLIRIQRDRIGDELN